jgi:MFS family permease
MELDDLKRAWGDYTSKSETANKLTQKELGSMLLKRTRDINERIGRNIRIGIGIVLGWIMFTFSVDLIASAKLRNLINKEYLTNELMYWASVIEILIYLLIFSAIIVFWLRYKKTEDTSVENQNLSGRIKHLIRIVESYKKMFYVLMGIFMLYVVTAFSSGFIMGLNHEMDDNKMVPFLNGVIITAVFLISVSVIVALYYWLFTFFFKRLYGKYLKQLKATLNELRDPEIHTN